MSRRTILVEKDRGVALVTLNQPERLNPLGWETIQEIQEVLGELARDEAVRAVLITGAGRAFSAGADLTAAMSTFEPLHHLADAFPGLVESYGGPGALEGIRQAHAYLTTYVIACPKPTIAAVNGTAVGGGLGLALACDIRIASQYAQFAVGFTARGVNPIFGCTYLLPLLIGLPKALELMYTGDAIGAQEALKLGLVSRVVPHEELMPTALALARKLAEGPPLALILTKKLAYQAMTSKLGDSTDLEDDLSLLCWRSEDFQEGLRSFREKREPIFRGR
ncbi:MAG TPA: enoyl-CoA hydratase/isomerase family protein [Dehalococcoidia bacterium]|nr:enoyl-CoA hydratase/isomerase family protein [Dehalococcoidia bacterium]HLB29647.1 enoyl-CoA hydratase/isomerase family protein [Dehalococcoidia bacterium]